MSDSKRRLCVFCGSARGGDPAYTEAAQTMGRLLADRDIGLVYGGGGIGLMTDIADAVGADTGRMRADITEVAPEMEVFETNARDGSGTDRLAEYLAAPGRGHARTD